MTQKTLFKLYSPVLKHAFESGSMASATCQCPPSPCLWLSPHTQASQEPSRIPFLWRRRRTPAVAAGPKLRLFPGGCRALFALAMLSPCGGCPTVQHDLHGAGAKRPQGQPSSQKQGSPERSLRPKVLRGLLSSVWFVESVICSGSHALWVLVQAPLRPLQLLANTASTDEGFPRCPSTAQGTRSWLWAAAVDGI